MITLIVSGRRSRLGIVLPVVVLTMLVMAIFFAAMSFTSRGQITGAVHYFDSSRAVILADAAVQQILQHLASGTFEASPPLIDPGFYKYLFSGNLSDRTFQADVSLPLAQYVNELTGQGCNVSLSPVSLKLSKLKVLVDGSPGGFISDPVEKYGQLQVSAVARIGNTSRQVVVTRGIKVFQLVHPVLSKFSLFVMSPPTSNREALLNPLKRHVGQTGYQGGLKPLQLVNECPIRVVEGTSLSFVNQNLSPATITDIEKRAGWVYLGGDTWTLGLSGPGPIADVKCDDRSVLRYATYNNNNNPDLAWSTSLIGAGYPLQLDGFTITLEGMREDCIVNGNVRPLRDLLFMRFLKPNTGVGLLRLFGAADTVMPTLVFGRADRRYLRVLSVNCTSSDGSWKGVAVPGFPGPDVFASTLANPPQNHVGNFRIFCALLDVDRSSGQFIENWEKFRSAMSRVITEPYVVGLDYLISNRESGSVSAPQGGPTVPAPVIPGAFTDHLALWKGSGGNKLNAMRSGTGEIHNEAGRKIFQGSMADLNDLSCITPKITARFRDAGTFWDAVTSDANPGKFAIPGIAMIGGDLTLNTPLTATRGGILIATGSVTINAELKTSGEPITIIAYQDISVNCSVPQEINAHLVCLHGRFRAISPSFHIKGGVAARELDFASLATSGAKTITYSSGLNPLLKAHCDVQEAGSLYRFSMSSEEIYVIEPGN